jgi:hypothetical protein
VHAAAARREPFSEIEGKPIWYTFVAAVGLLFRLAFSSRSKAMGA